MTRLTDGKRTVAITMTVYDGSHYTPDWSHDFFCTGSLPYDENTDAYFVPDVSYCIEQAEDWKNSEGDFVLDKPNENNRVFIEEE